MKKPLHLRVRASNFAGDNIIATTVFQALKSANPDQEIHVWTKFPMFFLLSNEVMAHNTKDGESPDGYDLDLQEHTYLGDYLTSVNDPIYASTPIVEHMMRSVEQQLGVTLPREFQPKVILSQEELDWAREKSKTLRQGEKHLVWVEMKTSKTEKNWPEENWKTLMCNLPSIVFIDLAEFKFREALALMTCCDAGVCLDSYPVHGAKAVGAKNTLVILISTPSGFVGYDDQIICDGFTHPANITPAFIEHQLVQTLLRG